MEPNDQELPSTEITQELWDAVPDPVTGDDSHDFAEVDEPSTASDSAAEHKAPAPSEPEAPAAPAQPDPFAALPEPVRLALVEHRSSLDQRLRSAEGRVAALQRELAQRPAAPAPEPEAPRKTAIDAIRGELPEVVAAIEEARAQAVDPEQLRQQIRTETMAEIQEDLLNDARPTWATDVTGKTFQTWLDTQEPAYAEKVRQATKASVLIGALSKFDQVQAAAAQAQAQQGRQQRRVAAAVAPAGARRPAAVSTDDMSDDDYWDHITKDS